MKKHTNHFSLIKTTFLLLLLLGLIPVDIGSDNADAYPEVESSAEMPAETYKSALSGDRSVSEEILIGKINGSDKFLIESFYLKLDLDIFTIVPRSYIEDDMSKYMTVDQNNIFNIAPLDQIYFVETSVFFGDVWVSDTRLITNLDSIWMNFGYHNYTYNISPRGDDRTDDQQYHIHKLEISYSAYNDQFVSKTTSALSLSLTTLYPKLVFAGSHSFYNNRRSTWGADMLSYFDGGGSKDMKSVYENIVDINWNLRRMIVFTCTGCPSSSSNIDTFLDDYNEWLDRLSAGDDMFPFHTTVIFGGHTFTSGSEPLGVAAEDSFDYIQSPSDLGESPPTGVVRAIRLASGGGDSDHQVRFVLAHEVGHIANGDHNYYSIDISACWKGLTYGYSIMKDTYKGEYSCSSNRHYSKFTFSSTNLNRIRSKVELNI